MPPEISPSDPRAVASNRRLRRAAFWYPSRVIGGAESLLIRLITALAGRGVECHLWDHPDGHVTRILIQRGVAFRAVACDSLGFPPPDALNGFAPADVVTIFHTHLFRLQPTPCTPCKLLVWEVHNAFWLPEKSTEKERLKRAVCSGLAAHGGLATIEPGSHEKMRLAGIEGPAPRRIPISVDLPAGLRPPRTTPPTLFTGLGRASYDKIVGPAWAFAKIARRMPAARFAYLCEDPARARETFRKIDANLADRIEFPEGCVGASAQRWLVDHADVVLSMGASALDAAKHGIPTVIVDSCEERRYPEAAHVRPIWENEGHDTVSANPSTETGRTLDDTLDLIASDPAAAGAASAAYVARHHAGDATVDAFLDAWENDAVRLDEFVAQKPYAELARREHARLRHQEIRRAWKQRIRALFSRQGNR